MGNHDQFTDVSLFPTAVGDAQLPPGMLREKHSGLDKSLMGLEMRGGGGGGHVGCPDDEGTDELVAAAAEKSAPSMAGSSNGMTLDLAARLLAARLLRSLLIIAAI